MIPYLPPNRKVRRCAASVATAVGHDSVHIVRLYPEGAQEHRMPRIPWARYVCGCSDERGVLFLSQPESSR